MSGTSFDLPLFVAVMGVAAVASAYLVIRLGTWSTQAWP